ncbi:hypothetical protein TanjilG_24480 [Lupinus angustifolius]|uniref:TF-B3 domain-containing protein n=1 Tax=Lupinus angustifolius TaxID=3871 RepID=A0A1J7HGY8_LUPAN|nr:hypothetical protein TanjilG_24480 [Lupinus angustifolius]
MFALPQTFSNNLKEKLPENVGLRGPCDIVWTVGLTTRDGAMYFTRGWPQFVKDHSLKENDLLVFKYNGGESLFDVLIFDGESFCEKVDSYFVRKCDLTENGVGCLSKKRDTDNRVNEVNTPSNAGVECAGPEKSVQNNGFVVPAAIPFEARSSERTINAGVESASPGQLIHSNGNTVPISVPSQTTDTSVRNIASAATHVQANQRGRPPKVSSAHQGVVDTDNRVEEVNTLSNAGLEYAALEKSVHGNSVIVPAPASFEAPSSERTTHETARELVSAVTHVQTKRKGKPPKVSNTPSNAGVDCAALEKSVHHNTVVPVAVPFETPIGKRTFDAVVESANPQQFIHANAGVDCAAIEKSVHHNTVVPVSLPFETPIGERTFDAIVESASPQKFIQANGDIVPTTDPLQTTDRRFKIRKLVSAVKHVHTKQRGSPPKISSAGQGVADWVTDSDVDSSGQSAAHIELYTSNRRPVTEHEINSAQHLAQAACTKKSLLIVMQPEQVYTGFYVSIPSRWVVEHLPPRSQDLVLRVNKTEWHVKYCYDRIHYTGELTLGWRKFALDNNLEEFDVCVFQPMGKVYGTWLIDVKIFRVVKDITPPTIPKPPLKRGRKRAISNIQTE